MRLVTKFWRVTIKGTYYPDLHKSLACKFEDGSIHIFGLGSGFHQSTVDEKTAKQFYEYIEDKPVSYNEMITLYKKVSLSISEKELKCIYRDEIVS